MFEKLMSQKFSCGKLQIKVGNSSPQIVKDSKTFYSLLNNNAQKEFDYINGTLTVKVGGVL